MYRIRYIEILNNDKSLRGRGFKRKWGGFVILFEIGIFYMIIFWLNGRGIFWSIEMVYFFILKILSFIYS